MEPHPDFKELLERFNARGIEYLIVGGYALAVHGAPRYTHDLDLWVRPTPENAARVIALLIEIGFRQLGCTVEDFTRPDMILQLGEPPIRADLITSLSGVTWDEAFEGKLPGEYGGVPVCYLGRAEFVTNKKSSGRPKDLADLDALGEIPKP